MTHKVHKSAHRIAFVVWIISVITAKEAIHECANCVDRKCTSNGECLQGCVPGFVDIHCKHPCPPNCINNTCHLDRLKGTYICSDGCQDGFCGSGCNRLCPKGCVTCDRVSCSVCDVKPCVGNNYGEKCTPCSANFEKCDKDTGTCIKCKKGFYGQLCETRCPRCLPIDEERKQKCQTGCDVCLSECKAGFHGSGCDLTCNNACAEKTCAQDSGRCIHGCIPGYEQTDSGCKIDEGWHLVHKAVSGILIAGLALSICLIGTLFVIKYYRKKQRLNREQRSDNETAMPLITFDKTRAEMLKQKTKDEIAWRTKDMVELKTLSTIVEKFNEGYKWITIAGNPGDGKTTLACLVLKHFQSEMDVFKLDSPDDYRLITWKNRKRMILLDDIFGAFTSDELSIQRWIPVLRSILENHEQNEKATMHDRIILTSRKNVIQDAQRFLERYGAKMLEEDRLIDLHRTDEENERLEILHHHLRKHKVDVERVQKEEVIKLKIAHGFPYCCKVYSELRAEGNDIDIVEFFKFPLMFLNETTKALFKSTGCRQLFKNMIRYEKFDINIVGDERDRQKMLVAASAEEGSYIWMDSNGICHFTNDSIHKSVLTTVASEDPLFVAKFASLTEIFKYMTITSDSDSKLIFLKPLPSVMETLGKRFEALIREKSYCFFGERLCFNKSLCEEIVAHNVYNVPTKKTVKQHIDTKDDEGRTMVTTAAMFNNTAAVNVLVTNKADVNIADCRGKTPLHYLCGAPGSTADTTARHRVDRACIEFLIQREPNALKKTDTDGKTPLDYLRVTHGEEQELIHQLEVEAMKNTSLNIMI